MKILAIYRHYLPDTTPYARILLTILKHQTAAGHEVTVVTAQPSYNDVRQPRQPWRERLDGVNVRRVRLLPERKKWRLIRAVNMAWFLVRGVMNAVFVKRYDLVIANSHPPVLMGAALRVIRALTGTPYIYHCQDIHPEAAAVAGDLVRGRLYNRLRRWDTAACVAARCVVVLSHDMAATLTSRGVPREQIAIINNPPLIHRPALRPTLPPPLDAPCDTVRFLFAGNLGRFQGLERLVAAARLIAGRLPFQLVFMGEGSAKPELMSLAGDLLGRRIVFIPHQPVETAAAAICESDYGVVSLLSDMYRFAYPSKSMMYWSSGCPVVAIVEPHSELAQTMEQHDLGYVASSHSVASIAEALLAAVVNRPNWNQRRRRHIEQTCRALFGQDRMLSAWEKVIINEFSPAGISATPLPSSQAA